jgi:hypothetical protein
MILITYNYTIHAVNLHQQTYLGGKMQCQRFDHDVKQWLMMVHNCD